MSAIRWVGKQNMPDRVGRSTTSAPVCETRWIVPVKPYEAPRGSFERFENTMLIGVAIAAIMFGFALIIWSSL